MKGEITITMGIYGNSILEYTLSIVNEAYIGRTPTMLEIEKQIGIIRQNASRKYTDINRSKEVQALNRLFEKQFGMEIFSLHVEQNNTINAYTCPVATTFDVAREVNLANIVEASQSEGYRFKKNNNLCIICNIYLGLLNCPDMTDAEIVAVILHELGHNFADCLDGDIRLYNQKMVKNWIQFLIWSVIVSLGIKLPDALITYYKNQNKTRLREESKKRKRVLGGLFKGVAATCQDFNSMVNEVIVRLGGGAGIKAAKRRYEGSDVYSRVRKSIGRQNEVVADKFAGIYGYGPEQASALLKMKKQVSRAERFVMNIPVIGKLQNDSFNDAFSDIYRFDCHPAVIQRLNEELKTLKVELNNSDLDPKLNAALKAQIAELEKLRDEAIKITDNMTESDQKRAAQYAKIVEEDPDAVDEEIEKKLQDAFDNLLKKGDK